MFHLVILTNLVVQISALSLSSPSTRNAIDNNSKNRRQVLKVLTCTMPAWTVENNIANAATATSPTQSYILERMNVDTLTKIEPTRTSNTELKKNGIDNLYYPSWLDGTWDTTQTLIKTSTPLGLKYVGGPNGSISIAKESLAEQEKQLNIPYAFQLKFKNTKFGVSEDRLFNTKQRLNAFAGRNVVSSVEYNDVGVCNRASILAMGGSENDPLQTTGKHSIFYFFICIL